MAPKKAFNKLLAEMANYLKENSFSRKGNLFYIHREQNWGEIHFQKSRHSTEDETTFTVNIGTCSSLLRTFFHPETLAAIPPNIEECHWHTRLGHLLPNHTDKWWTIASEIELPLLIQELKTALQFSAIPHMMEHISDRQLISLWTTGSSPGITNIRRLINLSVLLKTYGDRNALERVTTELKTLCEDSPASATIKLHLKSLEA